jgi:hypothetical protein
MFAPSYWGFSDRTSTAGFEVYQSYRAHSPGTCRSPLISAGRAAPISCAGRYRPQRAYHSTRFPAVKLWELVLLFVPSAPDMRIAPTTKVDIANVLNTSKMKPAVLDILPLRLIP